jgi:hypothetical protein
MRTDLPLFDWQPTTIVLPFPTSRRRPLVERCVRRMIDLSPRKAEEHLIRTVDGQRDVMRRRGIAAVRIEGDLAAFQMAVRHRYSRLRPLSGEAV